MVTGFSPILQPKELCEECLESKQSRSSFKPDVPTKANGKLEVIFSDVCGPLQTESLGGNMFFATFIDEFSRKVWIYLLKRKSEVFEMFKKFKTLVESKMVCMLRS